jgi:hypothetical protein
MSAEVTERTYGYHHPDYMCAAAPAITSKQQQNALLVVASVEPEIEMVPASLFSSSRAKRPPAPKARGWQYQLREQATAVLPIGSTGVPGG